MSLLTQTSMAAINLPMDLLATEILPRLPVKSLLRFKCVCKYFKTFISSHDFVNLHFHHSQVNPNKINRRLIFIGDNGLQCCDLDSPEQPPVNLSLLENYDTILGLSLVGSCNGLLCLQTEFCYFFFLNPSTRVYSKVFCEHLEHHDFDEFYLCHGFGFGGHGDDDYKAVFVLDVFDDFVGDDDEEREVWVYSMRSNSWKLVEKRPCLDSLLGGDTGVLIDNHLVHWKFWNSSESKHRIGCFDLRNECWSADVLFPDEFCHSPENKKYEIEIGELDGCLCLLSKKQHRPAVDVWVMKEYGVKDSWFKLLDISDLNVVESLCLKQPPIAYGKGSQTEVLLWNNSPSQLKWKRKRKRSASNHRLVWYNIKDKTYRGAEFQGLQLASKVCICNESFVSIPSGEKIATAKLETSTGT